MQRLREQTSSPDPMMARAAALLSSMQPLDVDRLSRRPLPPADARRRRLAGPVRTTLALAMTLGTVGAAAATLHRAGWLGGLRVLEQPAPPPTADKVRSAPSEHGKRGGLGETPGPSAAPQPPAQVAPLRITSAQPAPRSVAAPVQAPGASRERSPFANEDESALIVDAVRALRRDGDPVRAQSLAEEALHRYPHGAQVEEAMALAMEAAAARGDVSGARRAAERYKENFRSGRFADRAQRILAMPPR
jgi:hypothetical protein